MDLLGGYASSDSDEDTEEVKPTVTSAPQKSPQQALPKVLTSSQPTKAASQVEKVAKRKGSKILSLAAVLPQHILDQLTRATSYDVDSDDDDDFPQKSPQGKEVKSPPPPNQQRSHQDRDPGLNSFLQELHATKSSSSSSSTAKANVATSGRGNEQQVRDENISSKPKTILGAAFISSTVETTIVKKKGSQLQTQPRIVRDIHGGSGGEKLDPSTSVSSPAKKSSIPADQSKVIVETVPVDTDDGSSDSDDEDAVPSTLPGAIASTTDGRAVGVAPTTTLKTNAAPRVRAAPSSAPPVVRAAPSTTYTSSYYPVAPASAHSNNPNSSMPSAVPLPPPPAQQEQQQKFLSKKAKRRHMEQMLRAGNMSEINSDDNVIHMEGQGPTDFVPEAQTYQEVPSHGVRVVPVSMYGKAGSSATSTEISGKQRSKHQLNSLLASAASLEQQRARAPQASSSGVSHRVNAKRKYGW